MHILDTDASTNSLHWFMDSSTLRRSIDKLDMIKTSSRIDSNLMNRIGEPVMTGNRCSAPSPCRAFSNVVPSFHMADEIRKHQQKNLNLAKNDDQATEVCQSMSPAADDISKRIRLNKNTRYDNIQSNNASNNGQSNLSGFINGFILTTKQEGQNLDQELFAHRNGEIQARKKCSKDRRKEHVNKNSNNNRISPTNSLVVSEKSKLIPDTESGKTRENDHHEVKTEDCNVQASKYLEKQKHMEKYCHSLDINVNEEKNLNGSDILKRMYASFGSNGGTANRLVQASENVIRPSSHPPPIGCCTGDANRHIDIAKSTMCSSPQSFHRRNSPNHFSGVTTSQITVASNHSTSSDSSAVTTRNRDENRSCFDRKRSIHDEREPSVKYDNKMRQKSSPVQEANLKTKPSPVHSIDSLLSDKQKVLKDSYKNRQNQESAQDKNYRYNEHREEHYSRNFSAKHSNRHTVSPPHSSTDHLSRTSPSNSENDETYNDNSREIFRREKEIIENSIRQNSHLDHGNPTRDIPLVFPHLVNANALAAFQANLLASIPQNAQALSAMSLAAAASANPMLLGVNPCLVNPYLLSTLTGGETALAAYQQTMAQGLLQNYSAFKAAASGSPSLYPGAIHNLYGNIPFPSSPALSSALAASVPHNSGGIYPNQHFPYIPFSTQNNGNDSIRLDESTSRCRSNSPSALPPSRRTIEKMSSRDVARKSRLSGDKVPYKSIPPPKRHFTECAVQRPTAPHTPPKHRNTRDNIFPAKLHNKNKIPLSSKFPTKLKRKSPISEKIVTTKKRLLNTVPNANHTKTSASDFSPSALLNPSSSNEEDTGNTSQTGKSPSVNSDKGTPCRNTSYKNLTRERRLVANARERTRVHTISSAFEELRQQIPSYSCSQKLSKLAILRIACSYIQSLSVLSGRSTEGTFKESVDQCTRVLQAESRARSRRKSNKAQIEWEVANYEKTPPAFENDTQRRSLETLPPVAQRKTAVKSLSRESVAQVHDERLYRNTDDSPLHNEFSRDSYPVNTTRFETFNESCNQSNESVIEDKALTAADNNSLDAISGKIKRSPVNDMDGDTWTSNTRTPAGDNVSIMSTWRCDDKAETDPCNISQDRRETGPSPSEDTDENIAINESGNNADDQHIDIINVED